MPHRIVGTEAKVVAYEDQRVPAYRGFGLGNDWYLHVRRESLDRGNPANGPGDGGRRECRRGSPDHRSRSPAP